MKRRRKTFFDIFSKIKDNTIPQGVPPKDFTREQCEQAAKCLAKHLTIPQIEKRIRMYREQQDRAISSRNDSGLQNLGVMMMIDMAALDMKEKKREIRRNLSKKLNEN